MVLQKIYSEVKRKRVDSLEKKRSRGKDAPISTDEGRLILPEKKRHHLKGVPLFTKKKATGPEKVDLPRPGLGREP